VVIRRATACISACVIAPFAYQKGEVVHKTIAALVFILLFVVCCGAQVIQFKQQTGYNTYAVREPVLRIKPGDVVQANTRPSVGPIFVEGATTNDTLSIRILKLRPSLDTGTSGTNFDGALAPTPNTAMLSDPAPKITRTWKIDGERMKATLDLPKSKSKSIEVDLVPMLGRMAVAPAGDVAVAAVVPGPFGGNVDSSDAREGATVYLPIFHDGAYFYFGDAHGLQGDGELTGTGIETAVEATLQFGLIKNQKIDWPRMENDDYIMVAGSVRPLEDAFRIANVEMVRWLERDYGFDRWEALEVLSQLAVSRIANVVDPNYTVMAKFPKKYLPRN
jgi:amidase